MACNLAKLIMYKIENGQIIRIDGTVIAKDVTNPAYQQYIHWQTHGPHPLAGQPKQEEPKTVKEILKAKQQLLQDDDDFSLSEE